MLSKLRFTGAQQCLLALAALVTLAFLLAHPAHAQSADAQAQPAKVQELLKLMADPEVQKWVEAQKSAPPKAAPPPAASGDGDLTIAALATRIQAHAADLVAAVPRLPGEITAALSAVGAEIAAAGFFRIILTLALFVGAGLALEWAYWRLTAGLRAWLATTPIATIRDRLTAQALKLVLSLGSMLAFTAGSLVVFLALPWPPLIKNIALGYLMAAVIYRTARLALEFLLAPSRSRMFGDSSQLRVVPASDAQALFWTQRLSRLIGWVAFGWITVHLMGALGFQLSSRQLCAYLLGLVLLALGLEAMWNRPAAAEAGPGRVGVGVWNWAVSIYLGALWLLWVAGLTRIFWLAAVLAVLPTVIAVSQSAVNNMLRPPGAAPSGARIPSVYAAVIERGVRALAILLALYFLLMAWGVNLLDLAEDGTAGVRIVRGLFGVVVIALLGDFIWHVSKTMIDQRLADASTLGAPGSEEARRNARIRTLLPILRNVLMVVVATVSLLMILASIGIEIGPLIAGAGIIGVAVGFGAQTMVKDIISGVFYLLDDAFRIGEYIQSGSYKGTVESFSLRSIKLRHQRGAIYTVPFSELGAVQNMSRDWVIEKMTLNVAYDTDVDKARKIVKKIGLELAEDPEFKASTIEPLKMQGVDEFGEYAIVLRMKLKTLPGEQFGIKRRALVMIKKAFDENGIRLAKPTIEVSGREDRDERDDEVVTAHVARKRRKAAAVPV